MKKEKPFLTSPYYRGLYPAALLLGLLGWLVISAPYSLVELFGEYWASVVTMMMGSFVAGSTPLGGGAVAFPVLTKLLGVAPEQAKLFSLFIQSVGMTFATLLFIGLRINIHWRWLLWLMPGSGCALVLGLLYLPVGGHQLKLLFSILTLITGILLLKVHRNNDTAMNTNTKPLHLPTPILLLAGFPAGLLAALMGAGADTLLFFLLVIVFKHNSQQVIPTTVAFMALNSLVGSAIVLLGSDIEVSTFVSHSWLVAAPVVAIGAPLGGYVMSRAKPLHLLVFINTVILSEGISTLIFTPVTQTEYVLLLTLIVITAGYLCLHFWQHCYRQPWPVNEY